MSNFVKKSDARKEHVVYIKQLEEILAQKSEKILGKIAQLLVAVELEYSAVISGRKHEFPEQLKGSGEQKTINVFENSSYIARLDAAEPVFDGAKEITHDGNYAKQLEIVTNYKKPNGYLVTVTELAKVLETMPQILASEANNYGLERVDIRSIPFSDKNDQANACQFNINLIAEDGSNLYADTNGFASPLHICCINELLEFEKNGGLALYVATEQAYQRLSRNSRTEPNGHGVKPKRSFYENGTALIRGSKYNVARDGDIRKSKINDTGGLRTEHRLPSPEAITLIPDQSPYLIIESYLLQHIKALDKFAVMSEDEKKLLTAENLWADQLEKFPRTFALAKRDLENSQYLAENYPELQKKAVEVINSGQTLSASR